MVVRRRGHAAPDPCPYQPGEDEVGGDGDGDLERRASSQQQKGWATMLEDVAGLSVVAAAAAGGSVRAEEHWVGGWQVAAVQVVAGSS